MHFSPLVQPDSAPFMLQVLVNTWEETAREALYPLALNPLNAAKKNKKTQHNRVSPKWANNKDIHCPRGAVQSLRNCLFFASDTSQESYPFAELPSADGTAATCLTTGLVWDLSVLPTLYLPTSQTEPTSIPGPLDLSSPSSLSSSASSCGEEDEGRTSDPPSPEPVHTFAPRQRMKCTGVMARSSPPEEEEEREAPATAARPAFLCKHCPKEYTSLGALKMHIRSHTLPCVCTTCGKAFSRPWLLRGHIRTHTGMKTFQ